MYRKTDLKTYIECTIPRNGKYYTKMKSHSKHLNKNEGKKLPEKSIKDSQRQVVEDSVARDERIICGNSTVWLLKHNIS